MRKVASGIIPVIAVHRKSETPVHRQIYNAFRELIIHGSLVAGQQVPSTRTLAKDLGVSRFPVLSAYTQLLEEGYFQSRIGSGTVVSGSLPDRPIRPSGSANASASVHSKVRRLSQRSAHLPPFEGGPWLRSRSPFVSSQLAVDQFPFRVWSQLIRQHSRQGHESSLHYSHPMGLKDLREVIAAYLRTARAVRCEADQVMILGGSQQALDITARVLLDPGDAIWFEEPGYWLARNNFLLAGCHLIPVPVDLEGLDVAAGIKRCVNAKAVYITPSHQYPLGVVMSLSRRLQLLNWANSNGSWIIEDDYDSEYRYESMPIASLQGLDRLSRVIYIGTFSKVLFPSVRVGYVVIPPDLIDRFIIVRQATDVFSSSLYQLVLADFIREGHFERHIRRMRVIYSERRNALVDAIRKDLGNALEVLGTEAGVHLSVTLRMRARDTEISARAARQSLWLRPLSISYTGPAARQGFVLGFGGTPAIEMPSAVRRLRAVLQNQTSTDSALIPRSG